MLDVKALIEALAAAIPEVDFVPAFGSGVISRKLKRPLVSINEEYEYGADGAKSKLEMLMYVPEGVLSIDCAVYYERAAGCICGLYPAVTGIERKRAEIRDGYLTIPFSVTVSIASEEGVSAGEKELPCGGVVVRTIPEKYSPVCGSEVNAGAVYEIELKAPVLTEEELCGITELQAAGYIYPVCRLKYLKVEHGTVTEAVFEAAVREVSHE